MKRVIVIGAGIGGLASAIRLAHAGFAVSVLEKNARVGGKMNMWEAGDFVFDTGPSLLTMPSVLSKLFEAVGKRIDDYVHLLPVDPICRYFFADGTRVDASSNIDATEREIGRLSPADSGNLRHFLQHGKRIYDAAAEPFLFSAFGSWSLGGIARNLRHVASVFKIDGMRTLNDAVEEYFSDPRIRQLFNRFATYNGSSPYVAPATLAIIPYIEFSMGGWYVKGGMYGLARALERLAIEAGVEIRTSAEVQQVCIRNGSVNGVRDMSGRIIEADIVVTNADALYARRVLLRSGVRDRRENVEPSLSGVVLLLGVRKRYPHLAHHNIFFSPDYRAEFDQLLNDCRPPEDPTIYVCNTSATDIGHAPAGCSNLFVMVNAPPLANAGARPSLGFDWSREKVNYRNRIVRKLECCGLAGIGDHIDCEHMITPADFEQQYNAYRGSIYGSSSNGRMAAFLRPANRSRSIRNLYFAGGSAHPGGGIPLVLLSAEIVSGLIQRDVGEA